MSLFHDGYARKGETYVLLESLTGTMHTSEERTQYKVQLATIRADADRYVPEVSDTETELAKKAA